MKKPERKDPFGNVLPQGITFTQNKAKPYCCRVYASLPKPMVRSFACFKDATQWLEAQRLVQGSNRIEALGTEQASDFEAADQRSVLQKPLGQLMLEWFDRRKEMLSQSTIASYRAALEDHLLPWFGSLKLCEVSREQVIAFLRDQKSRLTYKGTKTQLKTIDNRLLVLKQFYDDCLARGYVAIDVITQARKLEFPRKSRLQARERESKHLREHFLTKEDASRLLEAARRYGSEVKNGLPSSWKHGESFWPIQTLLLTGIRLGELCALVWGDLETSDLFGNSLAEPRLHISKTVLRDKGADGENIVQNSTKGKVTRYVPVNEELRETFAAWRSLAQELGYDLSSNARIFPICRSYSGFKSLFRRVAEKAGLPSHKQGPHTLRHAVATHLVANGVGLSTVQGVLGHQNQSTTEKYVHALGTHQIGATETLNWQTTAQLKVPYGNECEKTVLPDSKNVILLRKAR